MVPSASRTIYGSPDAKAALMAGPSRPMRTFFSAFGAGHISRLKSTYAHFGSRVIKAASADLT